MDAVYTWTAIADEGSGKEWREFEAKRNTQSDLFHPKASGDNLWKEPFGGDGSGVPTFRLRAVAK